MEMPASLRNGVIEFFAEHPRLLEMAQKGQVQELNCAFQLMMLGTEIRGSLYDSIFASPRPSSQATTPDRSPSAISTPFANYATSSIVSSPEQQILSNSTEIPREEIECDIETLVIHIFRDNLKASESSVDGHNARKYGKKCGFPEIFNAHATKELYPSTVAGEKRRRDSVETSPSPSGSLEGPSHSENAEGSACKRMRVESGDLDVGYKSQLSLMAELKKRRIQQLNFPKPKVEVDINDMTYSASMVRIFPGTENRTPEQQEKRRKNCVAAQISRQKKKEYEAKQVTCSREAFRIGMKLKRQIACWNTYAMKLIEMANDDTFDYRQESERNLLELTADFSNLKQDIKFGSPLWEVSSCL